MRMKTKTFDIKDNSSYVCTGKMDWGIPVLTVLLSIMEILASINFLDINNDIYIKRQIVLLIIGGMFMLIFSHISYRFYIKKVQVVSAVLCLILAFRDALDIDLPYVSEWLEGDSFHTYIPSILLALGCFSLATVGEARKTADILDIRREIASNVVIIVIGSFFCGSWKYLLIYLVMTVLIISIRFPKGFMILIAVAVFFIIFAGVYYYFLMNNLDWRHDIVRSRIIEFLDPFNDFAGIELANSLYMIYCGGLFGQGIGGGNGVLGSHTDIYFLVSKLIQDMGLLGLLCFILLFAALSWRIILTIIKASDQIGFYLGVSILLVLLARFLGSMMVNLNLIPFVGISLPFCGTGSLPILIDYVLVGVVLNISRHRIEKAEI